MVNQFKIEKRLIQLPQTLSPNTIYIVRVGDGFDLYCSDITGSIAHSLNTVNDFIIDGGFASSSQDYILNMDFN